MHRKQAKLATSFCTNHTISQQAYYTIKTENKSMFKQQIIANQLLTSITCILFIVKHSGQKPPDALVLAQLGYFMYFHGLFN
jgi:hypothetical protein